VDALETELEAEVVEEVEVDDDVPEGAKTKTPMRSAAWFGFCPAAHCCVCSVTV
jgi:hypothetical protein